MKNNTTLFFCGLLWLTSCNQRPREMPVEKTGQEAKVPFQSNSSIYQLPGSWTTQDKKTITLHDLQGKVAVLAMIFTHCQYACPKITADMQNMESQIPEGKRNKVSFVLVSFDAVRDSSEQLKIFYDSMKLNQHWTLLHGSDNQVRELSVLLNVSYKNGGNGIYAHSNIITVLDTMGVILFQQEGLNKHTNDIVKFIMNTIR